MPSEHDYRPASKGASIVPRKGVCVASAKAVQRSRRAAAPATETFRIQSPPEDDETEMPEPLAARVTQPGALA